MKSYFIHNGPVALHVLESGKASSDAPSLLVIGGIWEPAERAMPLLSEISTHVVAFSFRGRGLSSTPRSGYDLADHLSDIEAVVKQCRLDNYCVLGFSRGASYALGWSLRNQHNMRGLILVDQPPIHRSVSQQAVDFWGDFVYQEIPILNFIRREALEGLGNEAREADFSSQLFQLQIPTAIFTGRNKKAGIPSDISDTILELYTQSLPACEVVEFQNSGHMIPDEEQQKYIAEVALFINKIAGWFAK